MPVYSSVPGVFDTLKAKLDAREALDGVQIRTGVAGDTHGRDSLALYGVEAEHEWGLLGNRAINEEYTITGSIWVYRRGGNDEADMKAARDATFAIYNELLETIRDDPRIDQNVRQSLAAGYQFVQVYESEYRVGRMEFDIRVENQLRS
jgi:hypothetical protein